MSGSGKPQNVAWDRPLSELSTEHVVTLVDEEYVLGESLFWCSREQELWWVDIDGMKICKLGTADCGGGKIAAEGWDVPMRPGSLALREEGGKNPECPLLVSFEDTFSFYDVKTGKRVPPEDASQEPSEYEQLPNSRLNDGRCDRQGRFLCGGVSMENHGQSSDLWKARVGLYRVEKGKGVQRILPGEKFSCYNSTCFSPDGCIMYYSDSALRIVWAADYEPLTGKISNKRVFVDLEGAFPDGAAVDAEGCVWLAIWGEGQVRRFSPEGDLLRTLEVPGAKLISCVSIGGPELDILFISSASAGLTERERMDQPNAGGLFAIRLKDVKGVPEPCYAG